MSSYDPVKIDNTGYIPKQAVKGQNGWYNTNTVRPSYKSIPRGTKPNPTKLRKSITPGTILIVLAGRFAGKRVVFLKQLPSGLLLVTGPFKINGVPLRRVNQRYVIATSTKIDVSGADVSSIDDTLFQRAKPSKAESGTEFFAKKDKTRQISDKQKSEQKRVDTPLIAIVKKTELLKSYLRSNFALSNHQAPHKLKF